MLTRYLDESQPNRTIGTGWVLVFTRALDKKRLGEIAESLGCPVFMVESETDLEPRALARYGRVGVTAGASTPNWVISRIVEVLQNITAKAP